MAKKKVTTAKLNKLNETEIVVVLDRSGSMTSIAESTVEGFNKFLNEQQNAEGEAFITLIQFDDRYELNYASIPVKTAAPLVNKETFVPRGTTALLDAIGKTIEETTDKFKNKDVVMVIITDGEENASRAYKREAISKMINTKTAEGWKFIFLAANQDAIASGASIGISSANSMSYGASNAGTLGAFTTISENMGKYRITKSALGVKGANGSRGISGQMLMSDDEILQDSALSLNFTQEQRDEQKKEGAI